VNLNIVWRTAEENLPRVVKSIDDYLTAQPPPGS
jgi:uncharacterized protein with HEPN domain